MSTVGTGDAPIPGIKTFHYLGFIMRLENGCQDKSARLIFIDEPRREKLAGYQLSNRHKLPKKRTQ
jgi:hypothetical protein